MSEKLPPLRLIHATTGQPWTVPHLVCGEPMLPCINPNQVDGFNWWWQCETCHRFVRPLSEQERQVVQQVLRTQLEQLKQPAKRSKSDKKTKVKGRSHA